MGGGVHRAKELSKNKMNNLTCAKSPKIDDRKWGSIESNTTPFSIVDFRLIWRGEIVHFIFRQFLRSASIKWDDHCVYVYFFYDGPISEENEESAQCAATEVIACFSEHQLEVNIQRLDYPHPLPQDVGELVYRRREAKPC